jgi:hypothetical protein
VVTEVRVSPRRFTRLRQKLRFSQFLWDDFCGTN